MTKCVSPWYKGTGKLGVKHQLTCLLSLPIFRLLSHSLSFSLLSHSPPFFLSPLPLSPPSLPFPNHWFLLTAVGIMAVSRSAEYVYCYFCSYNTNFDFCFCCFHHWIKCYCPTLCLVGDRLPMKSAQNVDPGEEHFPLAAVGTRTSELKFGERERERITFRVLC